MTSSRRQLRRRGRAGDANNPLRRLLSLADWPFDEFAEESLFDEAWAPAIDLKENRKGYVVRADLPGVDPDDIEVTMENGVLTVRGQREEERREEDDNIHRLERFTGRFERRFSLPDAADDGVEAEMSKGVLEIRVPKSDKAVARKIEIKG
ncbi:MAG TPA: Hsp20/alpha crystallin family protein [Wenzhouxiangella sp.]|nr:Hsp20/alpha crystallin family protein [Wenzhouxiangella sp.]